MFFLAKAPRSPRTSMFDLFLPQATLRALRLGEILLFYFSRKGAKAAKNFFICFVLAPNTSACSASLREFIVFVSRRGAGSAENFNVLFLPQTPLRALRPGESKYRWIFLYRQFRLYWQKIIVWVWGNATLSVRLNPDITFYLQLESALMLAGAYLIYFSQ